MKNLVLVSGGLDSAVALANAVDVLGKENVIALSIVYGQKHQKETEYAAWLANYYDVKHIVKDLTSVYENSKNTLVSEEDIPTGEYAKQLKDGVPTTYVPFRNGLFISYAAAIAYELVKDGEKIDIVIAIHSDDAGAAYPDCTSQFVTSMNQSIRIGTNHVVGVQAPFRYQVKEIIVGVGLSLDVPFDHTWSCYNGGDKPCGVCATCLDRKKAFKLNNSVDPVEYEGEN